MLAEDEELAPEEGAALDVDGVLLEPLAALLLGCLSVELALEDDPPDAGAAGAACLLASMDSEFEVELDGGVAGVVEPAEEDEALPGGVVRDTVRSPSLSQPVSNPAPSARDTATARVESLI